MEDRELIIKNILLELKQIPADYLQNLWNIIHTFRENINLNNKSQAVDNQEVWEDLIKDTLAQRQFSNQEMDKKLDLLFDFDEEKEI